MAQNSEIREAANPAGGVPLAELMLGLAFVLTSAINLTAISLRNVSANRGLPVILPQFLSTASWIALVWYGAGHAKRGILPQSPIKPSEAPTRFRTAAFLTIPVLVFLLVWSLGPGFLAKPRMLSLISAVVLAGCFALGAARYGLRHMYLLAAVTMSAGIWIFRRGPDIEGVLWVLACAGCGLVLSGAMQMRRLRSS